MQLLLIQRPGLFASMLIALVLVACSGGAAAPASTLPTAQAAPATAPAQGPPNVLTVQVEQSALRAATATAVTLNAQVTYTAQAVAQQAKQATAAAAASTTAQAVAATQETQRALVQSTATAVAEARVQANASATALTQTRAVAATEAARPAPTAVLPPGLTALAGTAPDTTGAVPVSRLGEQLVLLRDVPQLLTDDMLLALTTDQIRIEKTAWDLADCFGSPGCVTSQFIGPAKLNPKRSKFLYEWQRAVEQTPDLARGPLLDLFVRPDADWSFVKHEPEWDDKYANYVQVFIFSRDGVQGREPEFAARELAPVFRRHAEAVAARAPTTVWFSTMINATYDFATSTLRSTSPSGDIDIIGAQPYTVTAPGSSGYLGANDLPDFAHGRANYSMGALQPPPPGVRVDMDGFHLPGLLLHQQEDLVPSRWALNTQRGIDGGQQGLPPLSVLSLDRQLRISPIAMDAARAEALTAKLKSGAQLMAKAYLGFDKAVLFKWGSGAQARPQALITARVLKVDLFLAHPQPGQPGEITVDEQLGTFS